MKGLINSVQKYELEMVPCVLCSSNPEEIYLTRFMKDSSPAVECHGNNPPVRLLNYPFVRSSVPSGLPGRHKPSGISVLAHQEGSL